MTPRRMRPIPAPGGGVDVLVTPADRTLRSTPPAPPPDLETLKHVDILAFSAAAERAFVQMVEHLCEKMPEGVPVVGLRAEAAYRLNISTETAKRYIEKWCHAFSAPFTIKDGMVFRKVKHEH